jgi:DcuC family C4-dicarboxylate transporter
MIPTLIAAGIKPAMAAAAVFAGTFGSLMSPGNAHNVVLTSIHTDASQRILDARGAMIADGYTAAQADAAGYTYEAAAAAEAAYGSMTVIDVVAAMIPFAITAILIGAVTLTVVALIKKENGGYDPAEWEGNADKEEEDANFRINILKAIVPILPLVMLVVGSSMVLGQHGAGVLESDITVPQAMFAGTVIAWLVAVKEVGAQKIAVAFWEGMANAFLNVSILIAAAFVFASGMTAIGLTGALISAMQNAEAIVVPAAVFGPLLIAGLSGSGDGATIAFNNVVTPNAHLFDMTMLDIGNAANIGGALGRTLSPVAGGAIICAALAKVNPMEMAKRNLPGMIIAGIVVVIMASM